MGPAGDDEARTALVISAAVTRPAASVMACRFSSAVAWGSYSRRAPNPSGTLWVLTTRTALDVRSATCSATATMFLLLGRMTTSPAGAASTASRIWAVDGFID